VTSVEQFIVTVNAGPSPDAERGNALPGFVTDVDELGHNDFCCPWSWESIHWLPTEVPAGGQEKYPPLNEISYIWPLFSFVPQDPQNSMFQTGGSACARTVS